MIRTNNNTLLVIGNGMVGYKLLEKLVNKGLNQQYRIIVFGEEPHVAYDRVHLSEYFEHRSHERLQMAPRSWYADNQIELHTGDPVCHIDLATQHVQARSGLRIAYQYLVLATGSAPFVPQVPGIDKQGVFVYRTLEDLDAIATYAQQAQQATVIGGGLLGLEAAKVLLDLRLPTTVVEFAPRLMPRQLDEQASHFLKDKLQSLGLNILLNKSTKEVEGEVQVEALRFTNDEVLPTDLLVVSAGIRPRDELAHQAGIAVGPRGGILVDEKLQTSAPNVLAIGECALFRDMVYGLIAPGYEMAEVVAQNLIDQSRSFAPYDMSTKLKLVGVDVASFGDPFCENTPHHSVVYQNKLKGIYKRINISHDKKRLLGGILVGDATEYSMLLQSTLNQLALPADPETLILPQSKGEAKAGGTLAALPDSAMICSCENVSKKKIVDAVLVGNIDLGAIKKCTKAGTGCGGCLPMVKDLIDHTLSKNGKAPQKHVCEHFAHTRQELVHLVQIHQSKSFAHALQHFGNGHGCEICKPLINNIQASIFNHKVQDDATVLDTNDRYLANIQRGGTYSVVPRIAGGEITPEKLMVIARVAQKYKLYTKITGGQRIDLLGAKLNDLPEIWEELLAEGFETGQAYGKSVRTVKSCVGSTWCRYGVQDSVKMAIDIENRYKGLRAPHKLKFAVSGCTRECAEAQSKDIGVIATEKGWALYVAGNGGTRPRHADLFATDLDTDTCIRYIDRILSFYIRTADPLTRTATWLGKLEGGLDYLRDVVINDSLGIASELEAHLQHHVENYHCEWADVVNNPAKRALYKQFVNTNQSESSLEWVNERGQQVPAPW